MRVIRLAAWLVCGLLPLAASAQERYPSRLIRMVIGFPAGGPTDVAARLFAQAMSNDLGQQVIVDNKPGAGANVAAKAVLGAPADGYTILYNTSSLLLGPLLYRNAKFDPLTEFAPVVRTSGTPLVVAVNKDLGVNTLAEFIALAKARPGQMNYASSGAGTIDHLAAAMLTSQLGLKLEHVPYKGTAPALIELVGGGTQMMVTTLTTVMPFVQNKQLVPLAIASIERTPLLSIPTVAEAAGLPRFEMAAWNGIVVPAGTPPAVVARLNASANKALASKAFVDRLRAAGAEPYGGTAESYGAYLKSESARWKSVAQQAGVEPQ